MNDQPTEFGRLTFVGKVVIFEDKVKEMREAQKRYFKSRSRSDLLKSKELEKEVDNWLKGEL